MRDDQGRHLRGAVALDIGANGGGHGGRGFARGGELVLPAVLAPQLLGRGSLALAQQAKRFLVVRVDLAAVDR